MAVILVILSAAGFTFFCAAAPPSERECDLCHLILENGRRWYASNAGADEAALQKALLKECDALSLSTDTALCRGFVDCQLRKIFFDLSTDSELTTRTCIDIGSCDGPLSSSPHLALVDWTSETTDFTVQCMPVVILVLHHTVTPTALGTLRTLQRRGLSVQYIAGHNGSVYQMVHDYWRAWHAGVSFWRDYRDINSWSVGVEIVNNGQEPYPDVQMGSVIKLSRMIVDRWHIEPRNIVGHFDIKTYGKQDPSGYFKWKELYEALGFFPGVFNSALSTEEQHEVLMNSSKYNPETLRALQKDLSDWGYRGNINVTGAYDQPTKDVVQAFNRHWCPEIFILETIDSKTHLTITNPLNAQWYGISKERLMKLMATGSQP